MIMMTAKQSYYIYIYLHTHIHNAHTIEQHNMGK